MTKATPLTNGLSVDIEDWFQVGAFENTIDPADWDALQHRVETNTDAVIALFAEAGVSATFFTLGWVAKRYPALIRRIVDAGHEVASHGWAHARVFTMSAEEFAADIDRAKKTLEDAGGQAVTGYRAPSFSIDQRTPFAHRILAEKGYVYSSSVAPLQHDHYGWPDAPRFAYRPLADAPLIEVPVTTVRMNNRNFAAGGGGFFRLFPYPVSRWAIQRVNQRDGQPAIFYFHPWEIDPDQPRVDNAPLKSRLRHYARLSAMADKLRKLTHEFSWDRMDELVAAMDVDQQEVTAKAAA
ncbi:XrtA system polysaccharide deacetylase [Parasphingorhabdus sp. DH2-15]|uniref:XrtA system polysaccharide deacetylase n=1 Tax=Parasphingorhabdus sp. DH2-15 TaxID=3444112 RepID=UPI003F6882A4